jgi:RNA-directed DNA polymerase
VNIDIEGYFNNIDHKTLLHLLEKRIDDKRFISLINLFLKAGHMEDWRFHTTYSGTPQGGIVSKASKSAAVG